MSFLRDVQNEIQNTFAQWLRQLMQHIVCVSVKVTVLFSSGTSLGLTLTTLLPICLIRHSHTHIRWSPFFASHAEWLAVLQGTTKTAMHKTSRFEEQGKQQHMKVTALNAIQQASGISMISREIIRRTSHFSSAREDVCLTKHQSQCKDN